MKKLSFLYYVLLIASVGFITSCGNNDDDPKKAPSIAFVGSNGTVTDATAGDSTSVTVLANKGDEDLKTLAVTQQGGNNYKGFNGGVPKSIDKDKAQETVKIANPLAGQTNETVFTVTDKDGLTASVTFKITSKAAATALTEVNSAAVIYNKAGSVTEPGAFDLDNNKAIASSDAGAEIQDLGLVAGGTTWQAKWETESGATIAKVTGVEYATATKEQIVAAFGTSTGTTTGALVANELYVVKTATTYYLIKIVSVNNTVADNKDNVVFAYKK